MTGHGRGEILELLERPDIPYLVLLEALMPTLAADQVLLNRVVALRLRLELGPEARLSTTEAIRLMFQTLEALGLELRPKGRNEAPRPPDPRRCPRGRDTNHAARLGGMTERIPAESSEASRPHERR